MTRRPIVKGGQGRAGDDIIQEFEVWGGIALALLLILLCGVLLR
jgi:hypothetical protein